MSLSDEYRRQLAWRDWTSVLAALPTLRGQRVLDLGCGVGDLAAALAERGAHVVGVDGNEELLAAARARALPHAEFRQGDLHALPELGRSFDGLWCSFAAAYFVDLPAVLARWAQALRPGAWAALTEVDDFFAHEPLEARTQALLEDYVAEALAAKRYDFRMGRKLAGHLERAGFRVTRELALADRELAFDGPASPEVLAAWRARLERMPLLRRRCGTEFEHLRKDFLACLSRPDHRTRARVLCCLATR